MEMAHSTKLKLAAAIVLAALAVVTVLQNTEEVETRVLWISVAMPRALMLAMTFASGIAVGLLIAWSRARKD